MGKGTAPLPESLSSPTSPSNAGADDLLSQMAGDEIDRLLAEADVEAPSIPKADNLDDVIADAADAVNSAADPTSGLSDDALKILEEVQKDADALQKDVSELTKLTTPPADATPAPVVAPKVPETVSVTDDSISSELDDLFKQLTESPPVEGAQIAGTVASADVPVEEEDPVAAAMAAVAAENAAAPAAATGESKPSADASVSIEAKTATAGRAGLGLADLATSYATAGVPTTSAHDDSPTPFYLKPLEWINAPLADASDTVRELVGKAAIITLVNAAAVLVYVMFFRK